MRLIKPIIVIIWAFLGMMVMMTTNVTGDNKDLTPKELYKQNCRVCHEKESPNGEYSPLSLTQDQWKAFFKNKFNEKHKDVVLKSENKKLLEYLTTKNIETIKKYCVDHAADSEQPQTCSE